MKRVTGKIIAALALLLLGFPAAHVAAGPHPAIEAAEEEGSITIASFNRLLREQPDSVHWFDVRDHEEVKLDGTFEKARVMPIEELEDSVDELPADKPILFFCNTGTRSMDAYDIVKMKRGDLEVYFLEANMEFLHKPLPKVWPPD